VNRSFTTSEANLRTAFADQRGEIQVHLEAGELAPWAASVIAPLVARVVCSHPKDNAWIAKDADKCDRRRLQAGGVAAPESLQASALRSGPKLIRGPKRKTQRLFCSQSRPSGVPARAARVGFFCSAEHAAGISSSAGGRPPASRSNTRQVGSSERRAAITAPADPPPTTMKSKVPDMPTPFASLLLAVGVGVR
jgi:hypothetical protein